MLQVAYLSMFYCLTTNVLLSPPIPPAGGCDIEGENESWDFGTGAGFYVDATQDPWKTNYRMYSYITEEVRQTMTLIIILMVCIDMLFLTIPLPPSQLPKLINANFPTDPDRMSITGHSMGGHGALICALKNPGKYKVLLKEKQQLIFLHSSFVKLHYKVHSVQIEAKKQNRNVVFLCVSCESVDENAADSTTVVVYQQNVVCVFV